MSEELKPCPFCGYEGMVVNLAPHRADGYWHGRCKRCGSKTKLCITRGTAVSVWNRRAEPDMGIPATENKPLTLDELLGMDGEPVWVVHYDRSGARWGIVSVSAVGVCAVVADDEAYWFGGGDRSPIAYRRKPEPEGANKNRPI